MSRHFLNGTTNGAYSDTGPGTIVVDPLAEIHATGSANALWLSAGGWTVEFNGTVRSDAGDGIYLQDTGGFVSTVTVGKDAVISGEALFSIGINAAHRTNITNAGQVVSHLAGINESADGSFRIDNLAGGSIKGDQFGINIDGTGNHTIVNAGTIEGMTAIRSLGGAEKIVNTGIVVGNVSLGDGNDVFNNFKTANQKTAYGKVSGTIDLGSGDDMFAGGKSREAVKDGGGSDIIDLGAGNDRWIAYLDGLDDGTDKVDGGDGVDTYDASASDVVLIINLGASVGAIAGHSAFSIVSGAVEDVTNFENIIGGFGGDRLVGNGGENTIRGGSGDDQMAGRKGVDQLYGGAGEDIFVFLALKDSGPGQAARDTIHDFKVGMDHIGLTDLNENLGDVITGFLGVDVAFAGQKGDLRAVWKDGDTIVQLDANGDRKSDFSVTLTGQHALTVDDFYV